MVKLSNKQNVKNAIAYIPFAAFVLFFIEDDKAKKAYGKHLQYSMILCGARIVLLIVLAWSFKTAATLAYFGFAWYLAYKAYNGQDEKIEFLDKILKK